MFGDLIPHLQEATLDDGELRDKDWTVKYQAKENRDKRMGAKESLVDVGDQVLMKNLLPQNKLSTKFLTTPATVVDRVTEVPANITESRTAQHTKRRMRNDHHVKSDVLSVSRIICCKLRI